MPASTEAEGLARQIAHLKEQNIDLESRVTKAEQLAQGATKRAQARYTERIHANRHVERLEQDLANEKWGRNDDQIKSLRLAASYQDTIAQLRAEVASQQCARADGTQLQVHQNQITNLNACNEGNHNENIKLGTEPDEEKTSSTDTIKRLNDTIGKLSADLVIAKASKAPAVEAPGEKKVEARTEEITSDKEKKAAESLERQELELAKHIQRRVEAMHNQKIEEIKNNFLQKQAYLIAGVEQLRKVYQDEKQKTSTLQQQLKDANNHILWWKQHNQQQTVGQSTRNSSEKAVNKHGSMTMMPEQSAAHLRDVANKRRRLNSDGDFAATLHKSTTLTDPMTPSRQSRQEFAADFAKPQQQQNETLKAHNQALVQSQQRLDVNGRTQMQEDQHMLFQNQPSSHLFPTHLQPLEAMRPDGINSAQYVRLDNNQQNSQSILPLQHTVLPTGTNNGLQMHRSNGALTMHGSPLTQVATPNAQRPAMANERFNSPSSKSAHNVRLHQKIDAVRLKMTQRRGQRSPRPSSMSLNGTPDLQKTPCINAMTSMLKLPMNAQMQQNVGLRGHQVYSTRPQKDVDTFPELNQIGLLGSEKATGWISPALSATKLCPTFDKTPYPDKNFDSGSIMDDGFCGDDWYMEDMPQLGLSNTTLMKDVPSIPTIGTTHFSNMVAQQSQQCIQHHYTNTSLRHPGNPCQPNTVTSGQAPQQSKSSIPQLTANGIQIYPSVQQPQLGSDKMKSVQKHQAPASDREIPVPNSSVPALRAKSTHPTLAPGEPRRIACTNGHHNWWNEKCEGQPCTNCEGIDCLRPKCAKDATGTRVKGERCKMVHETDTQYYDPYLIALNQLPKRRGKKTDAKPAPSVLSKRKA